MPINNRRIRKSNLKVYNDGYLQVAGGMKVTGDPGRGRVVIGKPLRPYHRLSVFHCFLSFIIIIATSFKFLIIQGTRYVYV